MLVVAFDIRMARTLPCAGAMELLVFAFLVVGLPLLALRDLGPTRFHWIPGAAVMFGSVICWLVMEDAHGEAGVAAAMGNGVLAILSMILLGFGIICLLIGNARWRRELARRAAAEAPPAPLPEARVVESDQR